MWCPTRIHYPLLSILLINDITCTSNVLDFILFADDTTILYIHKDLSSKVNIVNEELEVSNWFKANKLSVNANKTNFTILGTSKLTSTKTQQDFSIKLHDILLERANYTKFLCVLIDECLTWKKKLVLYFKNNFQEYWCHE